MPRHRAQRHDRSRQQPAVFRKTKLCKFFSAGECLRGDQCVWAVTGDCVDADCCTVTSTCEDINGDGTANDAFDCAADATTIAGTFVDKTDMTVDCAIANGCVAAECCTHTMTCGDRKSNTSELQSP